MPRKRIPADLRSLARKHTTLGVNALCGILRASENDSARVAAAALLFDRGWGKAVQPVTGSDGGSIQIIIRQILDSALTVEEPPLLEHDANGHGDRDETSDS